MKQSRITRIISYLAVLVLLAITMFPVYIALITSVKPDTEILKYPPTMVPHAPSLFRYIELIQDQDFTRYTANTFIVALLTTALSISIGTLAAYALSRYKFRGNRVLSQSVLLIYMFPPVLLIIPLYLMMSQLGLVDNLLALVICYISFSLPLAIWMLKGFFDGLPIEIEDAAIIDGCDELSIMWKIVLPLSSSGITATAAFVFMLVWGEYLFAVTLIHSDAVKTLVPGLAVIMSQYWMSYNRLMAAAILTSIPAIVFFFAAQRYIVKGLVAGAIKG